MTARRGFTLVELMVTIVIIAILAGTVLVAAQAAQQAANRANTQALIAKLHGQLMIRYESFRTRRLPIDTMSPAAAVAMFNQANPGKLYPQQNAVALHRLNALRELMRMELPDRYSDIMVLPGGVSNAQTNPQGLPHSNPLVAIGFTFDSGSGQWIPGPPTVPISQRYLKPTAVNLSYQRRVNTNSSRPTADFEDAECLYLILNTGLSDDTVAGELIDPSNVGDADGDGMLEFHDAWGQPIRFIRWAPGFISDLQPYDPVNSPSDPRQTAQKHDPFDPLKMQHPFPSAGNDWQTFPSVTNYNNGMALVPLIYSMGPDRTTTIQHPPVYTNIAAYNGFAMPSNTWTCQFGLLYTPSNPGAVFKIFDPYSVVDNSVTTIPIGYPQIFSGMVGSSPVENSDGDNITNHLLGQQ